MIDMKNNAKCDSWMRYVVIALVLMGVNFVAPAQADDTQTITITGHRESKDPPPGPPTAPPQAGTFRSYRALLLGIPLP